MKGAKSLAPPPAAVLAAARRVDPQAPSAITTPGDPTAALNLRLRVSTILALEQTAQATGRTMKLVLMEALQAAGIEVAAVDLEDRSPEKMRKWR